MSTKIYSGYKLPTMPMKQLLELCQSFKIRAELIRNNELRKLYSAEDYKKNYWDIRSKIADAEKSSIRTPLDMAANICFFPQSNQILAMTFFQLSEMEKEWQKFSPNIEYYGYWNNTDPEDGVSAKAWERRRKDWDKALADSNYVPSTAGFTYSFIERGMLPYPDELFGTKIIDSYSY